MKALHLKLLNMSGKNSMKKTPRTKPRPARIVHLIFSSLGQIAAIREYPGRIKTKIVGNNDNGYPLSSFSQLIIRTAPLRMIMSKRSFCDESFIICCWDEEV